MTPTQKCVPKTRILNYFRFGIDDEPQWFSRFMMTHFPKYIGKDLIDSPNIKIKHGDYVVYNSTDETIVNVLELSGFKQLYLQI